MLRHVAASYYLKATGNMCRLDRVTEATTHCASFLIKFAVNFLDSTSLTTSCQNILSEYFLRAKCFLYVPATTKFARLDNS